MEYRKLPHGGEQIGVLGLGMGGIQNCSDTEIEQIIRTAIKHGINFFDLCAGGQNVYAPFGKAITGQREKVMFQLHFGAVDIEFSPDEMREIDEALSHMELMNMGRG